MKHHLTPEDWQTYKTQDGETKFWKALSSAQRNQNKLMADTGVFWFIAHEWEKGFYLETNTDELADANNN